MPASITIAFVALRPNVAGSRRLIPASGPTPGSTPTSVPTTQPTNAESSTGGDSATENPSARFWMVSSTDLEAPRAARQRHAQQRLEQVERAHREEHREREAAQDRLALEDPDEERERDGG